MVNVSAEFERTMEERTDFEVSAVITFTDGSVLNLSGDEFSISNNNLSDSAGLSGFPLGVAIEKVIQIELMNEDDRYYASYFYGAKIQLYLSFKLSETTETIDYGTYTVITPETYDTTVVIQAADDMYLADDEYESELVYPATLREIVQDACATTGIYLLTTTFNNDQFVVEEKPEGITFRQVIAMAAMIACGYARMDFQGRLRITSYSTSMFDFTAGLDGGIFDYPDDTSDDLEGAVFDNDSPDIYKSGPNADGGSFNPWSNYENYSGGDWDADHYETGDKASGGSFNPWDDEENLDGGSFEEMRTYHVLYNFAASNLKLETDDVVITGIQTVVDDGDDEETYLCGEEGYVLSIENDLITGHEEEAVSLIGAAINGLKFRPFEGEHIAYPIAEYGDVALVCDRKGRAYPTFLTDIDFVFRGYTDFKCSAESPMRNSSSYYSNSDYVKAVIAARRNTAIQISQYDQAVQMLTNLMVNSMGVFKTEEVLEDGSTVYYLHDKPTLKESTTIWQMTADAFAVSTDGGKTWNAGMDSEGNVVVNVLSAIGINFDWAHGGTLTLGGYDNINGQMRILNSSGSQVGYWDKDGIKATAGEIGGWTLTSGKLYSGDSSTGVVAVQTPSSSSTRNVFAAGGTSHDSYSNCPFRVTQDGTLYASKGTFGGSLNAATGTFSGDISAASGTFSGTIKAASGSVIGGWTLTSGKIYGGTSSTGTAVMQAPSSSITWVFAAGGTSHDSYANSPFRVDKSGNMYAESGTFGGKLDGATGTFSGSLSAATGTFKGSLSAATGTFAGSLSAATGSFAGSISAASGTFTGSIKNTSGSISTEIASGRLQFYYGSTLSGYVSGVSNSSSGYGIRIAASSHIAILTGSLQVNSYAAPGVSSTNYSGMNRSVTLSSGHTIYFHNGIACNS